MKIKNKINKIRDKINELITRAVYDIPKQKNASKRTTKTTKKKHI